MCREGWFKREKFVSRLIKCLALLTLMAAYIFGYFSNKNDTHSKIEGKLPGKTITILKNHKDVYLVSDKTSKQPDGWLITSKQQGWGGPMDVGIWIDQRGVIKKLLVIDHRETPVFFNALIKGNYFDQYRKKHIQEKFITGQDIDAVSGATISSRAIGEATRKGAHRWGHEHFGYSINKKPFSIKAGSNEFIMIVLYAVIIISFLKRYRRVRYFTLAFSTVFMGFYLRSPISVSAFGSLLMGYMPSISSNVLWWILFIGAILMALIMGKNLYCYWACPFGGIQEFIHRLGGFNTKVDHTINKIAGAVVYFLFWLSFMLMFLSTNPAVGTFEPFAVLFSFKGYGIQWYLVSIAIFGSFFIPRFWCRFFCPVGLALTSISKIKRKILKLIKTDKRKGVLNEKAILQ